MSTNTDEISTQDENDPPVDEVEASTYQLLSMYEHRSG